MRGRNWILKMRKEKRTAGAKLRLQRRELDSLMVEQFPEEIPKTPPNP